MRLLLIGLEGPGGRTIPAHPVVAPLSGAGMSMPEVGERDAEMNVVIVIVMTGVVLDLDLVLLTIGYASVFV